MDGQKSMNRVISENSLVGYQITREARNLDSTAAMVEVDDDDDYCSDNNMEEYTPLANIANAASRTSTAASSLSGDEDVIKMDVTIPLDTPPQSLLRRHADRMNRSDSRASDTSSSGSVRNSVSGNWGWFEDVHGGEAASGSNKNADFNKRLKKATGNLLTNVVPSSAGAEASQRLLGYVFFACLYGSVLQIRRLLIMKSFPSASLPVFVQFATMVDVNPQDAIENPEDPSNLQIKAVACNLSKISLEAAAMAVTAPHYVLEESLSTQLLWKYTAGNRPPQPVEERAFYEKMWAQNFVRSNVNYQMPVDVLTAASPISLSPFADGNFDENGAGGELSNYNLAYCEADGSKTTADVAEATLMSRMHDPAKGKDFHHQNLEPHVNRSIVNQKVKEDGSDDVLTVLVRGDNVFGTTVSKSFPYTIDGGSTIQGVDTVNISVASYRVVESKKHGKYAQFLVIYREGSIRDTIGVWKRYSDFKDLSKKVEGAHESCSSVIANLSPLHITEEQDVEILPNAITSWRLLKKRQRWYRCLDAGYLSLKVFLLERFLHDILFESSSPRLLREFVGKDAVTNVSDDDSY